MIDGRLAFVAVGDWWSRPDCFYLIDVAAEDRVPAAPSPGDDLDRVSHGTAWYEWRDTCNDFPVFYGQALQGVRTTFPDGDVATIVRPKSLRKNVIYEASTLSPGSSSGGIYFRLDGKGHVENLTYEQVRDQAVNLPSSSHSSAPR